MILFKKQYRVGDFMYDNYKNIKLYKDNLLPNINPINGYKIHKTDFTKTIEQCHTHEYYEFFFITNGEITHCVNHSEQFLNLGTLVFVRPEDVHFYKSEKQCSVINIAFNHRHSNAVFSYLEDIFNVSSLLDAKLPPIVHLLPTEMHYLNEKIKKINIVSFNDTVKQKFKIRQLLVDILSLFFKEQNNEFYEQIPFWLMNSYEQIQRPENFVKGIDRMVELSGKSPEHLSRSLKKYYNTSPSQLITDLKLNYALNLLMNTNMKIIDICFESGFVNLSTFYDSFKKQYATTPREFRKNYKTFIGH